MASWVPDETRSPAALPRTACRMSGSNCWRCCERDHHGARSAGDIERSIAGTRLCGLYQQIECGLVVQGRRRSELLGLAAELISNGGLMRSCSSHVGSPGQRLHALD